MPGVLLWGKDIAYESASDLLWFSVQLVELACSDFEF